MRWQHKMSFFWRNKKMIKGEFIYLPYITWLQEETGKTYYYEKVLSSSSLSSFSLRISKCLFSSALILSKPSPIHQKSCKIDIQISLFSYYLSIIRKGKGLFLESNIINRLKNDESFIVNWVWHDNQTVRWILVGALLFLLESWGKYLLCFL